MPDTDQKHRALAAFKSIATGRNSIIFYALVIAVLAASLWIDRFASTVTVGFMFLDLIPVLLIAMPMTLIIITGEIDLSVASTAGLSSALMGTLWDAGQPMLLVIVVCLAAGVLCGAANGLLIAGLGLQSLAVTIGTLALYRGLALVVIGDNAVANFPSGLTSFTTSKLGSTGIPTVMLGVAAIVVASGVVLSKTPFGRGLYAIGSAPEAASFVGINVQRAKFKLYVWCGFVSALTGIFWTLRYSSARSDNASGLELTVIAAVLLGGVSIFGGKGSISGVVSAVLLISTITYSLRLERVSDVVLIIVTGSLLIVSVVAPRVVEAISGARQRRRLSQQLTAN